MTLCRNINAINIMRECHSRNNRRAQSPTDAVILSHPDYYRRLQNYTGSADLRFIIKITTNGALAGFTKPPERWTDVYRRWGLSPRPEISQ